MRAVRILMTSFAVLAVLATGGGPTLAGGDSGTGTGKVNVVKAAEHKVNVTHDPIPELGWPGMTMDFRVAESVSLEGVEAGSKIQFHVRKADDGMYEIDSLSVPEK